MDLSRREDEIRNTDSISCEDRVLVLHHWHKKLRTVHKEICKVTSQENTVIEARQTQPAKFPLIHDCTHGGFVAGLPNEEVRIRMFRHSFKISFVQMQKLVLRMGGKSGVCGCDDKCRD